MAFMDDVRPASDDQVSVGSSDVSDAHTLHCNEEAYGDTRSVASHDSSIDSRSPEWELPSL